MTSDRNTTQTETANADDSLQVRRRRVLYRASYRGTRELDMLLGAYAKAHIDSLDDEALTQFEVLMRAPEPQLFSWITGIADAPDLYDTPLLAHIRQYCRDGGAVVPL